MAQNTIKKGWKNIFLKKNNWATSGAQKDQGRRRNVKQNQKITHNMFYAF